MYPFESTTRRRFIVRKSLSIFINSLRTERISFEEKKMFWEKRDSHAYFHNSSPTRQAFSMRHTQKVAFTDLSTMDFSTSSTNTHISSISKPKSIYFFLHFIELLIKMNRFTVIDLLFMDMSVLVGILLQHETTQLAWNWFANIIFSPRLALFYIPHEMRTTSFVVEGFITNWIEDIISTIFTTCFAIYSLNHDFLASVKVWQCSILSKYFDLLIFP